MGKIEADLVVTRCGQLLTMGGADARPKVGSQLDEVGLMVGGAVAVREGRIVYAGKREGLQDIVSFAGGAQVIDAEGRVVLPGFVDSHTHAVFGGSREGEFAARLQGKTYLELLQEGGGILSTMRATRALSAAELAQSSLKYLDNMLAHGTTTAEVKSGYGLNLEGERNILRAVALLNERHPLDLVPTFLGAHALPPEFADNREGYVQAVIAMLPEVRHLARYCDVFCEEGVFSAEEARKILLEARGQGLEIKLHADELGPSGGAELAAELGATSADHLDHSSQEGIEAMARKGVVGVLLPGVSFFLQARRHAPAREMIEAGMAVALATDFNPGSCPCENMAFILTLACLQLGMTIEQTLNAATINGAHALGLGREVGSLEVGKKADLVLFDLNDYRAIPYRFGVNHVWKVIKGGRVVYEKDAITIRRDLHDL